MTSNFPEKGLDGTVRKIKRVLLLKEMQAVLVLSLGELQWRWLGSWAPWETGAISPEKCILRPGRERPVRTAKGERFLTSPSPRESERAL